MEKLEVMVGLDDQREKENGMWTGHGRKRNRNSQSKGDEKIVETMGVKNGATGSVENKLYQIDVHV